MSPWASRGHTKGWSYWASKITTILNTIPCTPIKSLIQFNKHLNGMRSVALLQTSFWNFILEFLQLFKLLRMQSGHQGFVNKCGYFLISNKEMISTKRGGKLENGVLEFQKSHNFFFFFGINCDFTFTRK